MTNLIKVAEETGGFGLRKVSDRATANLYDISRSFSIPIQIGSEHSVFPDRDAIFRLRTGNCEEFPLIEVSADNIDSSTSLRSEHAFSPKLSGSLKLSGSVQQSSQQAHWRSPSLARGGVPRTLDRGKWYVNIEL
jgi:hypothetical protein